MSEILAEKLFSAHIKKCHLETKDTAPPYEDIVLLRGL